MIGLFRLIPVPLIRRVFSLGSQLTCSSDYYCVDSDVINGTVNGGRSSDCEMESQPLRVSLPESTEVIDVSSDRES